MKDLDWTLDECLNLLSTGQSSLADCLARYPDVALELQPLLKAALRLERGRAVQPTAAFKARARARLTLHMQAHPRRQPARSIPFFRLAFSMAALLLVLFATGTALAQSAKPGDVLYSWKLASERSWRESVSDTIGADLAISERRVDEMLAASEPGAFASALSGYQEVLARLTVQTDPSVQARILPVLQSQQERLAAAGLTVPELEQFLTVVATPTPVIPIPSLTPLPDGIVPSLTPIPILPEITPVPTSSLPLPTLPVPTLPNLIH